MKFIKQPKRVTLYTRAMCSWCMDAKEWLDNMGVQYIVADAGADKAARQRAIDLSGQTCVPVIEVDEHVLGDFDVGQLQNFLKKHGYLA
jgi:glutaredoxin